MATRIEQALATATPAPTAGEMETLAVELERLKEIRRSLLPIEKIARDEIEVRIKDLQGKVDYAKVAGDLSGLSLLDPDVFSWKKEQVKDGRRNRIFSVPVFAYVPLSEAVFQAEVSWSGHVSYKNDLPRGVSDRYTEIFKAASRYLDFDGTQRVTFSYSYPGVIPDHVRQIVVAEQEKKHFDRLALVCEVDQWKTQWIKAPPPPVYLDPILVGEREGALWVLASFDPTPLEDYLVNEFAR